MYISVKRISFCVVLLLAALYGGLLVLNKVNVLAVLGFTLVVFVVLCSIVKSERK